MLDKLGGVFAPRPSTGPHKLRESLPLVIFLRNRLKYALVSLMHTNIFSCKFANKFISKKLNKFPPIFIFDLQQTNADVTKIVMQRLIKVDGKVRTDSNFPAGFMDVITIEKTGEHFRLIYDVKGRFTIHRISAEEAKVSEPKIWLK